MTLNGIKATVAYFFVEPTGKISTNIDPYYITGEKYMLLLYSLIIV